MKIGFCLNHKELDKIEAMAKYGADFCEFNFNPFASSNKNEVKELKSKLDDLGLTTMSYNCMLPGGSALITGKDKNWKGVVEFCEPLFDMLSGLGRRLIVFGSSGARQKRDYQTVDEAKKEIAGFVGEVFVPLLAKYDWKCAIEPLSECNVIRTTYDGLEIVNKVNDPHFGLLADIYHMVLTGQKPSELLDCKGKLIHTHIASENGRKCPHPTDPDNYGAYIDALRAIGYDDCVSVEGGNVDGETLEQNISAAVTTLRKYCK